MQKLFENIYSLHHWYDEESLSGPGASLRQTQTVRTVIATVLKEHGIKTLLDIPCGDFNWMKEVDLTDVEYTGADIVSTLIEQNESRYSSSSKRFNWSDITSSPLPKVDLIFCRDCLVHFSYPDIRKAIQNIKRSKSKFLLTTTFVNRDNEDIRTGSWRPLNLQRRPFSFPQPMQLYIENCTEANGEFADKAVALWRIKDIAESPHE
jgi:2-polyprenyl-3-methyl-5-hydroxy-6-metoxy-1,4-benzoquinol methylase